MDDVTIAVTLGGICVLLSTGPQMIHTLRSRKTRDVDFLLALFGIIGVAFYLYYGIKTQQWIWVIADGIDMSMWVVVLAIKFNNVYIRRVEIPEKDIVYKSEYCRKHGHYVDRQFTRCLICDEETEI